MRFLIFIILVFSFDASAKKFCDILDKKTGEYMGDFEGPCVRANAPGVGKDEDLTVLIQNTEKEAKFLANEAAQKAEKEKRQAEKARINKAKALCKVEQGELLKELCLIVLGDDEVSPMRANNVRAKR